MLSTSMRRLVRVWTLFVLVFLYAPLLLVMLNAFNTSKTFAFPPSGRRDGGIRRAALPVLR